MELDDKDAVKKFQDEFDPMCPGLTHSTQKHSLFLRKTLIRIFMNWLYCDPPGKIMFFSLVISSTPGWVSTYFENFKTWHACGLRGLYFTGRAEVSSHHVVPPLPSFGYNHVCCLISTRTRFQPPLLVTAIYSMVRKFWRLKIQPMSRFQVNGTIRWCFPLTKTVPNPNPNPNPNYQKCRGF